MTAPTIRKKTLAPFHRENLVSDWRIWVTATITLGLALAAAMAIVISLAIGSRGLRLRELLGLFGAALIPSGFVAKWYLRNLLDSVRRMTDAAHRLAEGDRNLRHIQDEAAGDLGDLARAFNRMLDEMETRQLESRELAERLTTVLGAMSEGVLAIDHNQRILFANRAAGRLLGFDSAYASGRKLVELARNQMLLDSATEALVQNRVVAKESKRYELDAFQGNAQTLAFRATPISGSPPPGVVIVLLDITELRRLEFMRQEFVANVSHELKTPLAAIKAYAETLMDGALDDKSINRKFLGQIETEADRLHELILDLLRLAKIESGHQPFEIGRVAMRGVAKTALERFAPSAAAKHVRLTFPAERPDCFVLADEEGLQQIVDNLVDNAVKYTESGGEVQITWQCQDRAILIEIQDTGVGIPKESLHRIFERFYRVDKARSRELGSTGLGLAIVKHLVQSFGGTITVRSEVGCGSTFMVRLPLADETVV